MNNLKFFGAIFLLAVLVSVVSCKKEKKEPEPEPVPEPTTGTLRVIFDNMVDTVPLNFNQNYINPKGDTFKVSKFIYYISNIVLTKTDNSTFTEPESYHLVDQSQAETVIVSIPNVPIASYKAISFVLGVDSARSSSGAQTGDLDPARGMYWTWANGYVMVKLEGSAPKSGATGKYLEYHIGGYSGVNKAQRNFNLSFGAATANVTSNVFPLVFLKTNVNEFFKTPNLIDFTTQYSQLSVGSGAKTFADNYADMITFKKIQN